MQLVPSVICMALMTCSFAAAEESDCISKISQADLCAMASYILDTADVDLPFEITEGFGAGSTVTALVTQGPGLVVTLVHPLALDAIVEKIGESGQTLDFFQRHFEQVVEANLCPILPAAAFLNLGGRLTIVYVTTDNKAFAFVHKVACSGS